MKDQHIFKTTGLSKRSISIRRGERETESNATTKQKKNPAGETPWTAEREVKEEVAVGGRRDRSILGASRGSPCVSLSLEQQLFHQITLFADGGRLQRKPSENRAIMDSLPIQPPSQLGFDFTAVVYVPPERLCFFVEGTIKMQMLLKDSGVQREKCRFEDSPDSRSSIFLD